MLEAVQGAGQLGMVPEENATKESGRTDIHFLKHKSSDVPSHTGYKQGNDISNETGQTLEARIK